MSGNDADVPEPSKEELGLLNEQTQLLRMQRDLVLSQQRQQQAILPVIAKGLGFNLKFNGKGEVVGATPTKEAASRDKMTQQLQEQTLQQLLDPRNTKNLDLQARFMEQSLKDLLDPKNREIKGLQRELLELQLTEQKAQLTGPAAKRKREIERLLDERTLAGLKGNLPVDPALERDISDQEETLRQRLQEQFGPGYETSSPAIEALSKFEESSNVLRSQARRGELTLSEQLGAVRGGLGVQQAGLNIGAGSQGAGIPGLTSPITTGGFAFGVGQAGQAGMGALRDVLSIPGQAAGQLGSVAGGYSMPMGWFQGNRQMELNANIANSQQSGPMDIFGSILGGAASTLPFPWV